MGLFGFGKKKKKPESVTPEPEVNEQPIDELLYALRPGEFNYHFPESDDEMTIRINIYVNMTEKNVKVDVPDDENGLYIKGVYLWAEEKSIRGMKGDEVIFEITSRSKAYKELEEFKRRKTNNVTIWKRDGEYGSFYRVKVGFDVVRE